MRRPEKKEYKIGDDPRYEGYNQAYDEWENWIEDNREEMMDIHGISHSVIKIKERGCER